MFIVERLSGPESHNLPFPRPIDEETSAETRALAGRSPVLHEN
jgi:hypothetical protein